MAYKVLIPEDVSESGKKYLRDRGFEVIVGRGDTEALVCEDVVDCDALLVRNARYNRKMLEAGKKLKIVARHGIGVDNIDVAAATELGIQVVNAPTSNVDTVAEYVVAMMLAMSCRLFETDRRTREGDWGHRLRVRRKDMSQQTIGIVGFGKIGRSVAHYLASFACKILVYDGYVDPSSLPQGVELVAELDELLTVSDVVTLHAPSTPETKGMMGKDQFEKMKDTAYFINCARGDLCVQDDLVWALENNVIAGAALDVYEQEPLPAEHPLLKLDNLIMSQHCAAMSHDALDRMAIYAAQGIDEFFHGKPLTWPVNHVPR